MINGRPAPAVRDAVAQMSHSPWRARGARRSHRWTASPDEASATGSIPGRAALPGLRVADGWSSLLMRPGPPIALKVR